MGCIGNRDDFTAAGLIGKTISIRGEVPMVAAGSELGKECDRAGSTKSEEALASNRTKLAYSCGGGGEW